jgi:hypothetical protein
MPKIAFILRGPKKLKLLAIMLWLRLIFCDNKHKM